MPHDDDGQDDPFVPIAESLPKIKPPSRVKRRLIESAVEIADDDPESLLFQHTVFCQVGLPYRDPGNHVREWIASRVLSIFRSRREKPSISILASGSSLVCHGVRSRG